MQDSSSFFRVLADCIRRSLAIGITVTVGLSLLVVMGSQAMATAVSEQEQEPLEVTHPAELKTAGLLYKKQQGYQATPTLHTDVQITISGMIARTKVIQTFENPTGEWKEAVYVFPLPESAAVDELRMRVGERTIIGEIKEKAVARKQYQQAKKSGKRASLLEQERPNIFTSSIANIGPHDQIEIEIEYQQLVKFTLDEFSLRFPTVVAPRYIPGKQVVHSFSGTGWAMDTDVVPDASRITPPVIPPGIKRKNGISISVDLDAGFEVADIRSPYHQINIGQEQDKGRYQIKLVKGQVTADRDFVLRWTARAGNTPTAAFFRERIKDNDYALLMIVPPRSTNKISLNREIIFVIDTSGSMAGSSIGQAKSALQLAMKQLGPGDRFNIIQFNSYTTQLFHTAMPFNTQTLTQAQHYVSSLQANGGTEMAPAIRLALARQEENPGVRQVVFLTDGSVGNERALFKYITEHIGDSRLFTIGIGSAPNSWFMSRAASFGRGTHTYIGNIAEVEQKMSALFNKLQSPVLGDISLELDKAEIESWPKRIPDLYLGEPLLLSLKSPSLPDQIKVSGTLSEKPWQTTLKLEGGQQRGGIGKLWARRKIRALVERKIQGLDVDETRQQIINTAMEHHLVSKHTSLVAIDPGPAVRKNQALRTQAIPANLPAGWQYDKVFGAMPATASPASLYFLLGALLLLASMALRSVVNRQAPTAYWR